MLMLGVHAVHWRDRRACNKCFERQQAYAGHDCKGTIGKARITGFIC